MKTSTLARAVIACAAMGLTGCATVGPNYVTPEVTTPATWQQLDAKGSTRTTGAENYDLSRWWLSLDDTLLSELIEKALSASPDLRSAQAKLRESRARRSVPAADRYPGVTASGSASLNEKLGITVLMVTHEPDIAAYARRVVHFVDGFLNSDERKREIL
ncbi:hypothetical protein E4633_10635 [Geomonas terrae]|uniref:RND transporter n=1 Tax=Geomonas terrae TaxID=2562681 RepID=A0A4S1CGQ0_9BACT|nr:TolC family protein [Geomonas terrae]TGU72741.1 hypothetical protein E4633_10635 [Geomonas terrae]